MMYGFVTESGTIYYVDTTNRLFSGGRFKNPQRYDKMNVLIGTSGIIYLSDGRIVKTSKVVRYLQL